MPRVTTIPSANACRKRAGRVRRFLSSRVCSCSPSSIRGQAPSLPLSPTINHIVPLGNPPAPQKGEIGGLALPRPRAYPPPSPTASATPANDPHAHPHPDPPPRPPPQLLPPPQ